jgi:hypothetical protein
MTKNEESILWDNIIDQLPAGTWYLKSILGNIRNAVHEAIANDFGFIDWTQAIDTQTRHQTSIKELEAKRLTLRHEIEQLERRRDKHLEALNHIRTLADSIRGKV